MQLLNNEKTDKDNLAQIIEGDKGRKQERFLQIWAVLGPDSMAIDRRILQTSGRMLLPQKTFAV
jgi:hypothetical protein